VIESSAVVWKIVKLSEKYQRKIDKFFSTNETGGGKIHTIFSRFEDENCKALKNTS